MESNGDGGRLRRRDFVKRAAAAISAAPAIAAAAEAEAAAAPNDPITPADVETALRLSGRDYPAEKREQMARRLAGTRTRLEAVRAAAPEIGDPAVEFDPRLPGMKLPKLSAEVRMSAGPAPRYDGNPESLAFASVVELSRLVKARRISSAALTRMYLDRLKRIGPRLNCVVTLTEELALRQAESADREIAAGRYRGPLHGIPWGAKDLLATKGIRTTWGAKPYEAQVFDYDATVVRRLEEAGAVLVAKLTTGELALGDVWFGGMTRNPWDPKTGSSGSSAGPGSATAAGLVGFSIGSETLGSITSPSVVNGVAGLRPTFGRVSRHGAMALCWTMDKLGPMCRSVEDCALVLAEIYGPDGEDGTVVDLPFGWNPRSRLAGLRVGIDTAAFAALERAKDRKPVYDAALDVLRGLGLELKPVELPPMSDAYRALAGMMIDVESAASFSRLTETGGTDLLARQADGSWPNTFRTGATIPAVDYLQALRVRRQLQRDVAKALEEVDLYVTVPFAGPSLVYTNLTGHPELVTRCGMLDGKPESISFVGALYREDAILRVAHAFERATPWHRQWPNTEKIPPLSTP
ncbi:MAG: amidase [Armatimonadota bacterium]